MQETRVERAAADAGLRIARRRDVVPRAGKDALFGVYVMRATKTGAAIVEPPLVVRDVRGAWTPEFRTVRRAMGMPDRPPSERSDEGVA